jgi:hypothetical protein
MYMVWSLLHIRLLESGSNAQGDDQTQHFLYKQIGSLFALRCIVWGSSFDQAWSNCHSRVLLFHTLGFQWHDKWVTLLLLLWFSST